MNQIRIRESSSNSSDFFKVATNITAPMTPSKAKCGAAVTDLFVGNTVPSTARAGGLERGETAMSRRVVRGWKNEVQG